VTPAIGASTTGGQTRRLPSTSGGNPGAASCSEFVAVFEIQVTSCNPGKRSSAPSPRGAHDKQPASWLRPGAFAAGFGALSGSRPSDRAAHHGGETLAQRCVSRNAARTRWSVPVTRGRRASPGRVLSALGVRASEGSFHDGERRSRAPNGSPRVPRCVSAAPAFSVSARGPHGVHQHVGLPVRSITPGFLAEREKTTRGTNLECARRLGWPRTADPEESRAAARAHQRVAGVVAVARPECRSWTSLASFGRVESGALGSNWKRR